MDNMRASFSELSKDVRPRPRIKRVKPDGTEDGAASGRLDSPSPSLRPESHLDPNAEVLVEGVTDSTDALGRLKSVAGGLFFILANVEVWSSSHTVHNAYRWPSERRQIDKR